MYKNFYHTLNILLCYLVKCKRSKMTQTAQKLQQNVSILKLHKGDAVVDSTLLTSITELPAGRLEVALYAAKWPFNE